MSWMRAGALGWHRLAALIALSVAGAALLGWAIISHVNAAGGGGLQNFPAATFTAVEESTHNKSGTSVCKDGVFVPSQQGSENKGDLNAKKGSFLDEVQLPQGAAVRSLSLFVNDADGDDGAHVFLVRKRVKPGLAPQFDGYKVMGGTKSAGAVTNVMRKFSDTTIAKPTIDNRRFFYYLELVNCATVEPFDVQIAFQK